MCNEYLKGEIAIINPKIICLLGNTPYYSILGGKEISRIMENLFLKITICILSHFILQQQFTTKNL